MKKLFLLCLLVVFGTGLSACATVSNVADATVQTGSKMKTAAFPEQGRADFSLEGELIIYNEAKIYLSDIQVNVSPNQPLMQKPAVLFVPLGLTQSSHDHIAISQGVSRILWQQMLAEQTFAVLEFSNNIPPYTVQQAVPVASAMGAEFIIGGYITYFLDGASSGDSKIGILLEIYDTATGALLWSLGQSGVLPYKPDRMHAVFSARTRMPMDPMSALIASVGNELAVFLHGWTDPEAIRQREQEKANSSNKFKESLDPSAFGKY